VEPRPTKAESRPLVIGRVVAVTTCIGGILLSAIFLGSKEKSILERLWPPTVAWVAWCVIGVMAGNIVRNQAEKKHACQKGPDQNNGAKNGDLAK
jgi:hypothetical protein